MNILNIEIKARCPNPDRIRQILKEREAEFKGTDRQVDTYFEVPEGRLKLREGTIENNLIYYEREDTPDAKSSHIELVSFEDTSGIKSLLTAALPVKVVVDKKREIYFINNVKFHIDEVKSLGSFVEVEAIDRNQNIGKVTLEQQCNFYRKLFNITDDDLVANSYSDMLNG
ncbi:class IV adenylate cyclase [Aliifodinibius sp. S!AR15-10]|uniref:class IV adenylate cyclase n=1 Tax=Aliifodinibius sp. S!AR15-10 TaxID=2950437 RepID=UPI00285BA8D5|nr:class IV adenylate cyclase [Aliifodinibius sp. S!AR15-10]MDR8392001.1 class IV adenylate cyclase [Aliifodinibius sp. S!AR15-10]